MINAILLYGSKARGDHNRFSDTDLLGVSSSGPISKPYDESGLSFHVYPHPWLQAQAAGGSLFLLHIVTEAKVVFDPSSVLDELQTLFKYKDTYQDDVEVGSRVIAALKDVNNEIFTNKLRRRYFWGLRTALMAAGAQQRAPSFSGEALERLSNIAGLEAHIKSRDSATMSECKIFADKALSYLGFTSRFSNEEDRKENLRALLAKPGMASLVGAEILYGD